MPRYSVCGLTLASSEIVPGIAAARPEVPTDVTVLFGAAPEWVDDPVVFERYRAVDAAQDERIAVLQRAAGFSFRYGDGTEFDLDLAARTIWCRYRPPFVAEDAAVYLLGPVLGFALRLRGTLALHASAVVIGGRAIALVGPAGAGKSTTAAFFASRGFPVLTDDVLALPREGGEWMAQRAYNHLRLWEGGERALLGVSGALPRVTPSWDKRALALGNDRHAFAEAPAPLAGVVFLPDDSAQRGPALARLDGRAAVLALTGETYANYLLDAPMRRAELEELSELVRCVAVWQASAPDDATRGPALVDAILDTVRAG